jgi:hypothetical protein
LLVINQLQEGQSIMATAKKAPAKKAAPAKAAAPGKEGSSC